MPKSEARKVVDAALAGLNRFARTLPGEEMAGDMFAGLDENVEFKVVGQFPWGGTHKGFEALNKAFGPTHGRIVGCRNGGVYPIEYIEEDDRVVIIAMGRGKNAEGDDYNNSYFMFYEVKDDKIVRFQEHNDGSISWKRVMNCSLIPDPA